MAPVTNYCNITHEYRRIAFRSSNQVQTDMFCPHAHSDLLGSYEQVGVGQEWSLPQARASAQPSHQYCPVKAMSQVATPPRAPHCGDLTPSHAWLGKCSYQLAFSALRIFQEKNSKKWCGRALPYKIESTT